MNPPQLRLHTELAVDLESEVQAVHALYRALQPGAGLGGKMLFAGELNQAAACGLRAANIAGAASLAATASQTELRHALHNGSVDFLVTSLDEALRILKNEIRKKLPVAVAVAVAAEDLALQMLERGVQPDLLLATALPAAGQMQLQFVEQGSRLVVAGQSNAGGEILDEARKELHFWTLPAHWNRALPKLEAAVAGLLPLAGEADLRWFRLSARYLGPQARRLRSLSCSHKEAAKIEALLQQTEPATQPYN